MMLKQTFFRVLILFFCGGISLTYSAMPNRPEFHYLPLEERLLALTNNPEVSVYEIATTSGGRKVWGLEFKGVITHPDKVRKILLFGGSHPVEWASFIVPVQYAEHTARWIELNRWTNRIIYLVPILNPDGFEYQSYTKIRYDVGRKNGIFPPDERDVEKIMRGVDLNRNFSFHWKLETADMIYYGGDKPFSEPETRGLAGLVSRIKPDFAVSLHCPGRRVQYPWGYTRETIPDEGLIETGKKLAGKIGFDYRGTQDAWSGLKEGCEIDWLYGEMHIRALRIELCETIEDRTIEEYANLEQALDWLIQGL